MLLFGTEKYRDRGGSVSKFKDGEFMEYLVLAVVIVCIVLFIFIKGAYDEKKKEKKFIEDLYTNYGQFPNKKYEAAQYNSIRKYFEKHKEGFFVDDITWNDLDMDAVFMQMNHTYSSAGEEYLYHTLRTPFMRDDELEEQEEKVRFFMENEDIRVKMQVLFAKVGKTGKFSIYDYLDFLDNVKDISNWKHYLGDIAFLISVILIFFSGSLGIFCTIAVICYNMTTYFKYKSETEPYIISFGYIMRMLQMAEMIMKEDISVISKEKEELKQLTKQFNKFKGGSWWLMSPTRMNGAGDPLSIVSDYIRMVFHIDIIKFNNMMKEARAHKEDIDEILTISGSIETAIAIGAYRASMEEWCIPEFSKDEICLEEAYHPLIENPVKNSISTKKGVLLTGSNASGKSTFLKTVAINAILGQTIYTCTAKRYKGDFYHIYSSMALRDNLESGESYYIVEIKSLKRIIDAGNNDVKILCFVDEVLRGTNTVERIAASTQILKSFAGNNTVCFAATHDIELTSLLEQEYDNYHFEEEVRDGDVFFNYELKEGKARTRNAIKLLSVMGYDKNIIDKAENMAENFIKDGVWK